MNSEKNRHILLISYVFPPYYGIGGRRWAKHAHELTKLGYTVHVICAKNPFKKTSLWHNLVKNNQRIVVYQLPNKYPRVLVDYEHTGFQKIQYKLWVAALPFFTKGSIFDRSAFWKKPLLNKATELIRKFQIEEVICSGAPFGALYFSTLLKEKFKHIFLWADLRDPWTWGPNWGYSALRGKRAHFELKLERLTIERADLVSVPSDDMRKYLSSKYPAQAKKIIQLPHFFDPEEISVNTRTRSAVLRFVMYGTIYHDMDAWLKKMANLFARYKNDTTLDIITDQLQHAKLFESAGASNVRFYAPMSPEELFSKFGNYDFVFLLNPAYNKNNISTKFYEIIYTRTPVFIFSEDGLGPAFIRNNGLGIHADMQTIDEHFKNLAEKRVNFKYNDSFDVSEYALSKVAKKIAEVLERKKRVPEALI